MITASSPNLPPPVTLVKEMLNISLNSNSTSSMMVISIIAVTFKERKGRREGRKQSCNNNFPF
jgi:hypothetical protein